MNDSNNAAAPAISIAQCTYNGVRFLREQLESIARQSRQPAELVVCDDKSDDKTVSIVRAFAVRALQMIGPLPRYLHYARGLGSLRTDLLLGRDTS